MYRRVMFVALFDCLVQDREAVPQYILTVVAVNADSDYQLSSTTKVMVTVIDVNDETPKFNQTSYENNISELASNQTYILTVMATDGDEALVKLFPTHGHLLTCKRSNIAKTRG